MQYCWQLTGQEWLNAGCRTGFIILIIIFLCFIIISLVRFKSEDKNLVKSIFTED